MSEVALKMENVYKRFRRGELYDSLRDLIPALTGKMFRRKDLDPNDEREFWALRDVSFEVEKGEAFAIIGHNGAGKSTILKILSRIMQPTRGRMVVEGRLSALIEITAGFHPDLTGRENVFLNGTILGMSRREIDSKLEAIVDFSGLSPFIDTPVKRYSSGMFARLGFAVAAHVDPDVLIVDEVLSVGDYVFQKKCIQRMSDVIQCGTTVLFVSHNLRSVSDLCQRGLLLDHGRVKMIGQTQETIAAYMDTVRAARNENKVATEIHVTSVNVLKDGKPSVQFDSGDRVTIEVEALANEESRNVAVVLHILDDNHYIVFDTSSERLGSEPKNLMPGERLQCNFDLSFNMAYGTYHVNVLLYRYDMDYQFDAWEPAATFFVTGRLQGFKGVVNCEPAITENSVQTAS